MRFAALVAQWIERLVAVQKVAGSIPAKDTLGLIKGYKTSFTLSGLDRIPKACYARLT